MLDHVKLLSFDLDDTLWPCAPVIRQAEQACFDWLTRAAPSLTARYDLEQLREHRLALSSEAPEIAHDFTELRRRSLAMLLREQGYDEALAVEANAVFRRLRNCVEPYAGVVEALAALRDRYVLVSITNGNAQIEFTPLGASFDYSLTAAQVGAAKPDPAMFHAASAMSGVPFSAFAHIGDDPLRDIDAARRVGITPVWVNPHQAAWPDGLERAEFEVASIVELAETLIG